jgi:hypothetical protein
MLFGEASPVEFIGARLALSGYAPTPADLPSGPRL